MKAWTSFSKSALDIRPLTLDICLMIKRRLSYSLDDAAETQVWVCNLGLYLEQSGFKWSRNFFFTFFFFFTKHNDFCLILTHHWTDGSSIVSSYLHSPGTDMVRLLSLGWAGFCLRAVFGLKWTGMLCLENFLLIFSDTPAMCGMTNKFITYWGYPHRFWFKRGCRLETVA